MALFMGIHKVSGASDEQLQMAWETYKKACEEHGIKATHAHHSTERGVAYCFTEAETKEEVEKAHEGMPVPLEDVYEVKTTT